MARPLSAGPLASTMPMESSSSLTPTLHNGAKMTQTQNYSNRASIARTSAIKLEAMGRATDAAKARADAIRYDMLAKLAELGEVK